MMRQCLLSFAILTVILALPNVSGQEEGEPAPANAEAETAPAANEGEPAPAANEGEGGEPAADGEPPKDQPTAAPLKVGSDMKDDGKLWEQVIEKDMKMVKEMRANAGLKGDGSQSYYKPYKRPTKQIGFGKP